MDMNIDHLDKKTIIASQTIKYRGLHGIMGIMEAYFLMDIEIGRNMIYQVCRLMNSDRRSIINNLVLEMIDRRWALAIDDVLTIAHNESVIDDDYLRYIVEYCRTRVHDRRSYDIANSIERDFLTINKSSKLSLYQKILKVIGKK